MVIGDNSNMGCTTEYLVKSRSRLFVMLTRGEEWDKELLVCLS